MIRIKYQSNDYDDHNYLGLCDIKQSFDPSPNDEYYDAVLVTEAFGNNYEYHEINSDKDRNKSVKQYLYAIIPSLTKLINEKKAKSQNVQKIQLTLHVRFNHTTDPTKKRTFCVKSGNIEIRQGIRTDEIIRQLIDSFL